MTKTCIKCEKELEIRLFHKQTSRTGKLTYRGKCAICYSEHRKEKQWDKKYYERKKNE
jgi:hypothetical protein